MAKCDLCETNEAEYGVSSQNPGEDWRRYIFLCAVCLPPALIALLIKLGLVVVDLNAMSIVMP